MHTAKKILYIAHSAGPQYGRGKGTYDLVMHLRSKLSHEYTIRFPTITQPASPTYEKFKKMFERTLPDISSPVVILGHSLGGSTVLKYLSEEHPPVNIEALLLLSTPFWKSDMKEYRLKDNFQRSLDTIPRVFIYHSRHDPFVPVEHLEYYRKAFSKAIVHLLEGKDHTFPNGLPVLIKDLKHLK